MTEENKIQKNRIFQIAEEAVLLELKLIDNADDLKRILSIIWLIETSGSYLFYSSESIARLKESVDNHLCFRKFVLNSFSRFSVLIRSESDAGQKQLDRVLQANITFEDYIFHSGRVGNKGELAREYSILSAADTMSMVSPWTTSSEIEDWIKFLHFTIFTGAYAAPFKTILNSEK